MKRPRLLLPAAEIVPSAEDILRQQGVPDRGGVSEQAQSCAQDAREQCLQFMKPQGILQEITREKGTAILAPEGVIHHEAPLPAIMDRADHLALFAVTLGKEISLRIGALFTTGNYPLASALDAAASLAADTAALAACRSYAAGIAGSRAEKPVSSEKAARAGALAFLPYSPGYCGWEVAGQRALFAALKPAEIGLTLNESCVMEPLKSVSGIILGGSPEIHIFRPDFSFCTRCVSRECGPRMASVLNTSTEGPAHE